MNLEFDDHVISWISAGPAPSEPEPAEEEFACRSCGYTGGMSFDVAKARRRCPACLAYLPAAEQEVECPNCGRAIAITEAERGRTILCANCKCFVGCVKKNESIRMRRKRRNNPS